MQDNQGKCPSCDADGEVGTPCSERACRKRGYHFIPTGFWHEAHAEGAPDPLVGTLIADFLVVNSIGAGGFGKVYLTLQAPLFRLKGALKLIEHASGDDIHDVLLEKFRGEAEVLAQVNHPNIVRLIKFGEFDSRPYLVMEYVENGLTLQDEMLRRYRAGISLDPSFTLHVFEQVLNALGHMHSLGIIHRDIKPDNIMLQRVEGNPNLVRILDFGLAKVVAQKDHTQLPLGTPLYMAPEQLRMSNLGPWTDLYAVSAMAFWFVTGMRPFPGDSKTEIIPFKLDESFDPGERLHEAGAHPDVVAFFRDTLAHNPEDRVRSVAVFRERLRALLEGVLARQDDDASVAPQPVQNPTTAIATDEILMVDEVRAAPDEQAAPRRGSSDRTALRAAAPSAHEPTGATEAAPERGRSPRLFAVLVGVLLVGVGAAVALAVVASLDEATPPALEPEEVVLAPAPDMAPAIDTVALAARVEAKQDALNNVHAAAARAALEIAGLDEARQEAARQARAKIWVAREEALSVSSTPHVVTAAAGKFHTCALLWNGRLRCWGANFGGSLGLKNKKKIGDNESPRRAKFVRLGGPVRAVFADSDRVAGHTCALDAAGGLRCWGYNNHGQLGYGHTKFIGDNEHPEAAGLVDVGGPVASVSLGAGQHTSHTCALLRDGGVRCWGKANLGQLGYGNTDVIGDDEPASSAPLLDLGGDVRVIATGKFHNCAILGEAGQVRCWGFNKFGQLGVGSTDNIGDDEPARRARAIELAAPASKLALGRQHTCAMTEQGAVYCWGDQDAGQLGTGKGTRVGDTRRVTSKLAPVKLGAVASQIVAGDLHTCALLEQGNVRCWGDNKFGQLGISHTRTVGDDETPDTQADVVLGAPAVQLFAGSYHTCAILQTGKMRCWGFNKYGQLGYGSREFIGDNETPATAGDVDLF